MKAMFAGFALMIVITVVAWYGLSQAGFDSQTQASGDAVRLD
ncbi:hypothetical protein ACS3SW_13575 [Roseobacteraceae bacterium S113]